MKKVKSPWYGLIWIVIWTAALIWFISSGMFSQRESIGLILVWAVMAGVTGYLLVQNLRRQMKRPSERVKITSADTAPSRNSLCPCGSGKKYKRCCAVK